MKKVRTVVLAVEALLLIATTALAEAPAQELPRTGLLPPTAEDLAWARKHMIIGRSVKLNALGLQRINDAAAENGKALISATALNVVPFGSEVVGLTEEQEEAAASVAPAPTGTVGATAATDPIVPLALPAAVDNSLLDAFPPIGNQGGLNSCVPFSVTYYTLTHMVSRANGINAKTGGTAAALSPKFVYNLFNGGSDGGGSVFTAMQVIMNHGAPHWANWPYDSNVTAWPLSASIWREAIFSRARSMGWIADVNTPAGLENLKTMLVNGYVLNFETWIYDWEQRSISDDPATTADDAFVGQKICRQVTSTAGPHAMAIVGYNDNLWLDINGNGFVDPGEKGALKIANSWGTGYWNSGFYWVAYDAIQLPTKVQGWTQSVTRQPVFRSNPYWMSVQPGYTPSHLAEITVSHRYRDQLKLVLGISGLDTTNPRKGWWPNLVYNGGSYAFDGGSVEKDCNFVLDFSDIVTSPATNRWYLTFEDRQSGSNGTLKSYTLVATSPSNRVTYAGTMPITFDYTQRVIWVDYGTTSTVVDVTAPPVINTLAVTATNSDSLTLRWQEVGDDSTNDWLVAGYDLRYSTNALNESTWAAATRWTGASAPGEPGYWASTTVTGLIPNTAYFFAVKAWDDAGNTNGISNVATGTTATMLEFAGVTNPLPVATQGSAYRYQMNATGGVPRYTWSDDWMNGLPNNLNIDYYAGLIAGTVSGSTATGLYTVAINLRDQGDQVSSNFLMEVVAPVTNAGSLRFAVTNLVAAETAGMVTTTVTRVGGATGSVSAQFLIGTRTGSDGYGNGLYAVSTNGTLQWADGNASTQKLVVACAPDNLVTTMVVEAVLFNAAGGAVINTGSVCRITLTDDDPALEVTPTNGLSVAEGGTNTLSVRLTRVPPAGPVTVITAMQAGSDPDLVVTAGSNLTFTTGTWSNWQMVVVSALEDGDQDSGTGRVEVALAGAPTVSVPATEFDNDIQIMTTTNAVMMGTDTNRTIGIKLATAPSQAVTVTVARVSGSTNIIVGSGTPAVFVATNWNAWRGVNISASLAGRAMNVEATLRGSSTHALSTDVQVSAPLVTAAYGTPYWWLSAQAGATNFATDELLDTDHDGAAAWQEYRAGTAPSNAASVFRILRMDVSGTVSRIWWYGTTNSGVTTPFIIECGPQLGATNGWTNISPDLGRSGTGTNEWQYSPSPTSGPAFYRVKIKE